MPKYTLTGKDVEVILRLWALGKLTQQDLAGAFGVNRGHVSRVVNNQTWKRESAIPRTFQRILDDAQY